MTRTLTKALTGPAFDGLPVWARWSATGHINLRLLTASACCGCKVDTMALREYYMVHDVIWATAGMCDRGILCIGCLETRLGHELTSADFTGAPINWETQLIPHRRSARLRDRLARGPRVEQAGHVIERCGAASQDPVEELWDRIDPAKLPITE